MSKNKVVKKKNINLAKYFLLTILFLGSIFIIFSLFINNKSGQVDKVQKSVVYKNKEYGFKLKMPDKWQKYIVKEKKINENWTTFEIGLPLETDFLNDKGFFRIINLDKMTISEFEKEKKVCEDYIKSGVQDGPCFYPREITRNNEFVFGESWYFTGGGYDPCLYEKYMEKDPNIEESYFCNVYKELDKKELDLIDYLKKNLTLIK